LVTWVGGGVVGVEFLSALLHDEIAVAAKSAIIKPGLNFIRNCFLF
jgi:hypothetical protein